MSASDDGRPGPVLVISAHAGDFVWRAGGAMALAAARGAAVTVLCLSYGERGESAKAWRDGKQLAEIKAIRQDEASRAAADPRRRDRVRRRGRLPAARVGRAHRRDRALLPPGPARSRAHPPAGRPVQPRSPGGSPDGAERAGLRAGHRAMTRPASRSARPRSSSSSRISPSMCDFKPQVLLDITEVFGAKRAAMECLQAQQHMWDYYTDLARRRGRPAAAQRRTQPRPRPRDHGRGLHADVPAGHQDADVRNVVVTGCPRADPAQVARLAEFGVGHRARGDRPHRLPRPRRSARSTRARASGGTAVTVVCWPGDNLMIHAAVEQCQPGDVLVVTTTSPSTRRRLRRAARHLAAASRRARSRDDRRRARRRRRCSAMGFPVFSAAVSAQGTVKATAGAVNVPVSIGGQRIAPGDAVVADDDGVVVVARAAGRATHSPPPPRGRTGRLPPGPRSGAASWASIATACARC